MSEYSDQLQWSPTAKQAEFLSCTAFEVLYGGAAGGGKTDALIVDALGLNQPGGPAVFHPRYRALMIRPTMDELDEVISRTKRMYPKIDPKARFVKGDSLWQFSSGATVEFNYLKKARDHERYRGDEFQYIGWEELTLHPMNTGYIYLLSRIRRKPGMEGIIPYVRATTNPDGEGHSWVKAHWKIPDDGAATEFSTDHIVTNKKTGKKQTLTRVRRFIPAKLEDNPHVDEEYEANLLSTSEDQQRAQKDGRWDIVNVAGVIYQRQIEKVVEEGRLCHLPIVGSRPVHTYWDMGNDNVSIWCVQNEDPWIHLVDFLQGESEGLAYYINWLRQKDYVLGTFFLPHDADHKRLSVDSALSLRRLINQLGITDTQIVPRIQHIRDGLEMTRQLFPRCRFDRERCAAGWEALKNYRYGYNQSTNDFTTTPVHNWASHPADAFRQIAQSRDSSGTFAAQASQLQRTSHGMGRGVPMSHRRAIALKQGKSLRAPKPLC